MLQCPQCNIDIKLAELKHPGLFKNFRVCPHCDSRFTVDDATKVRQMIAMGLLFIMLVLTLLLYYQSNQWLTPAIISNIVFGVYIYRSNKKVYLVPYRTEDNNI